MVSSQFLYALFISLFICPFKKKYSDIFVLWLFLFRIACVSAPSVYQKLKEQHGKDFSVCILEYDKRFSVYGEEFIFYDYSNPLNLPENVLPHSFDIVIADPPYLSKECLSKTAETIKYLTKGKVLLCTGMVPVSFEKIQIS